MLVYSEPTVARQQQDLARHGGAGVKGSTSLEKPAAYSRIPWFPENAGYIAWFPHRVCNFTYPIKTVIIQPSLAVDGRDCQSPESPRDSAQVIDGAGEFWRRSGGETAACGDIVLKGIPF